MKVLPLLLLWLVTAFNCAGASLTLAWDTSIDPSITGYKLYYGGAHGIYTNVTDCGKAVTNRITGLQANVPYFFVATAYWNNGMESVYSSEVSAIPTNAVIPPPVVFLDIPIVKATNINGPFLAFTNLQVALSNLQGEAYFQFGLSISGKFYRPKALPGFVPPTRTKALPPVPKP